MAAVSRMSNPERVVKTAVLAGVLRIDDQGRVWRKTKRGEVRAEKKLPNGYLQKNTCFLGAFPRFRGKFDLPLRA